MSHQPATGAPSTKLLLTALLLSIAAAAGSLALTLVLELRACPLCFYQRTFALSLAAVLGMGLLLGFGPTGRLSILALPLATGALGVALFHVSLEMNGTLACPAGLLGIGTAPQQSLGIFILLFVVLLADVLGGAGSGFGKGARLVPALALGVVLAVASCVANPPMPKHQPGVKDMCQPPA